MWSDTLSRPRTRLDAPAPPSPVPRARGATGHRGRRPRASTSFCHSGPLQAVALLSVMFASRALSRGGLRALPRVLPPVSPRVCYGQGRVAMLAQLVAEQYRCRVPARGHEKGRGGRAEVSRYLSEYGAAYFSFDFWATFGAIVSYVVATVGRWYITLTRYGSRHPSTGRTDLISLKKITPNNPEQPQKIP